ncbi:amino acid ABC transporter substrate-binding protein (PAAT family) [Rhizobium sp. BK251]|nr:amino acid ABC transporter substrate-binding protein (PAAT family) [Rhizobium sp. BK251]
MQVNVTGKLLFIALLGFSTFARAETIAFTSEEYAPFNYRDGRQPRGTSVEQVQALMADAGIDYTIEFMPWARAIDRAQTTPMTCIFTTARNPERENRFKWVEPLLVDRNILVAKKGSGVSARNLEEAKRYVVGTQRGDYTETMLRENGFSRLDVASDFKLTLKKLMNDRIDLMPISEMYYEKMRKDGIAVEYVAVLSEQRLGIACNRDFPDSLITRMQGSLDALIARGEQQKIYHKYGLQPAR